MPTADIAPIDIPRERRRLSRIRAFPEPAKRAEKAAEVAAAAEAHEDAVRTERDQAATALRVVHGWSPVDVYRLIGVTRGLFARIVDRNEARGLDERFTADAALAEKVARRTSGQPEQLYALAEDARQVRDSAIRDLLAAGMSNAAVARLCGLTTARIAQLRPQADQQAS